MENLQVGDRVRHLNPDHTGGEEGTVARIWSNGVVSVDWDTGYTRAYYSRALSLVVRGTADLQWGGL